MAEINPTDAIPATNASNTTRYFNLPLFIATDKPSWLVDWNGAMNEIDSILQNINTSASGAESDVETVVTQVNQLSGVVSNLESLVNTAVSDVAKMQTTVDSHEERMDSIEADLITQNNLIKSLSDAVTTMQATVGTLNSRVSAMETTVAGYDSRITSAEQASASASATATQVASDLQSLQGTVNTINTTLSSLNTRVTALENAGGGMPTIGDLNDTTKFSKSYAGTTPDSLITSEVTSQVIYTATNDCYINGNFGVNDTSGSSTQFDATLSVNCDNMNLGTAVAIPVNSISIPPLMLSFLIRLKAGDTISYTSKGTSSSKQGFINLNIYTPIS